MNDKELEQIIENHKHWLYEDTEGWEVMCADLSFADLRGVDLRGVDLNFADLRGVNLIGANLRGADLSNTDLRSSNLSGADLRGANLMFADLSDTNLRGVYLRGGNMRGVNLRSANLCDIDLSNTNMRAADLRNANLRSAHLSGADLIFANLRGANLRDANMRNTKNVPYIPMICPEEGDFIGYKKASDKIIKLYIPENAKRSSATTRKCRCDRATVLSIYELDGSISKVTEVVSSSDHNFIYKINKEVVVDDFDNDRWNECSTGIHFFMQRQEAINYII